MKQLKLTPEEDKEIKDWVESHGSEEHYEDLPVGVENE